MTALYSIIGYTVDMPVIYRDVNFIRSWNVAACLCNVAGTVGASVSCDQMTGHCYCKPNIMSPNCSECRDGFYRFPALDFPSQVRRQTFWLL